MKERVLLASLVMLGLTCTSISPPMAETPIDWGAVSSERVPVIVTQDPDGSERVTKLWLVVVDGQGLIRTGGTRWFRNIQRDPNMMLRIGGYAYLLRVELVADESLRERAHAAFREKYGWQDRLVHPFGKLDPNVMRLTWRK
jgi:hypothetical protein